MIYLVTIKLPRNPDHNPHAKVTGPCPADPRQVCTDVTGEHHTIVVITPSGIGHVRELYASRWHVTRIETAGETPGPQEDD